MERSADVLPATVPVRMLNEYTYCPRLFYLEWVQSEFKDNFYTVEGRYHHRRADESAGQMPMVGEDSPPYEARAIDLSSPQLGLVAKLDVVKGEGNLVTPIEYKRGVPPGNPERSYEPERVQLCAQGLLLREHGYECPGGILYFAQSKERVKILFDEALVDRTMALLAELKETALQGTIPPPLVASSKCVGCSLNSVCLPDETHHLRSREPDMLDAPVRRLLPASDDAMGVYVQEQGHKLGLKGDTLEVRDREGKTISKARLFEVSQVVLFGNIQVSTQALRELCDRAIPTVFLSYGGWFYGMATGNAHKNIELRRAQFRTADDSGKCLALAQRIVRCKLGNARTLLRRNSCMPLERALDELSAAEESVSCVQNMGQLLGVEGNGARIYFANFGAMLKPPYDDSGFPPFQFESRTRRPPRDPVNALLSLAYAMLSKDWMITLQTVGFDPHLGFYHQPKYGRPALALDMMEEFRPLIADSVVLQAVNTGIVKPADFITTGVGVALSVSARKRFIQAYERRMSQEISHPIFGYRISYRQVLEIQARLLGRYLLGEIPSFPEFRTR